MEQIELNPPFEKFEFGTFRSYYLYKEFMNALEDNYSTHHAIKNLICNTFNNEDAFVVGNYNGFLSFYTKVPSIQTPVFAYVSHSSRSKLTQVADSVLMLYKICSEIKRVREEYKNVEFLPKTPETVDKMHQIIRDFSEYSPNSYAHFWQENAFGELLIGLEI